MLPNNRAELTEKWRTKDALDINCDFFIADIANESQSILFDLNVLSLIAMSEHVA